ncbi:sodium/proline symporter PutP [Coralloluteibacterium stylophorae]|uniref:Sodium/proline symporter n=1 Tax=Coralloluteibacterium stylophorae TaxID=1776034 RepID=A0A8J7VQP3_9GAMM|nr:sodium/proline symporter PutP [Coralloluteibacterium stylophorae]MBS7456923.1 sodium/proline symporter PutP [Coralloluteibacterium stylophorae]
MNNGIPTYVSFALYMLALCAIGVVAWLRTTDFDDYILGGRKLGPGVTALSAGASDMSGWVMMGLPGAIFATGLSESWIGVGLVAGAWVNWLLVAGRLRVYTERAHNALTLPDYFTHRFEDGSRLLRIISALVILVFFSLYVASGVVAGGLLIQSVFGIDYAYAIWIGAGVTIAYTLVGGFLAVSWTDAMQGILVLLALLVLPVVAAVANGGIGESVALVEQVDPQRLDWVGAGGWIAVVSGLAWGLGYFGQPHILVRFMALDSLASVPLARRIGMSWMILCLLGSLAIGFFGIGWFQTHPEAAAPVRENAETVFITLTGVILNPWIGGFVLAAILAAVMSTLNSQLLVSSSALTEDFYRAFLRRDAGQRELVWVGRITLLLVSLLAIWMARDPEARVLDLVSYAWAGFGSAFGPVVLISLLWKRMTRNGALAGMLVGGLVALVWGSQKWFGLYEMIPGALCASLAIVAVSLMGRPPQESVRRTFDAVQAEVAAGGRG